MCIWNEIKLAFALLMPKLVRCLLFAFPRLKIPSLIFPSPITAYLPLLKLWQRRKRQLQFTLQHGQIQV